MLVSKYLAGGSLTALMKDKANLSLDIGPIAVGEAFARLVGKCLCAIERSKTSDFFRIGGGQATCTLPKKRPYRPLDHIYHKDTQWEWAYGDIPCVYEKAVCI